MLNLFKTISTHKIEDTLEQHLSNYILLSAPGFATFERRLDKYCQNLPIVCKYENTPEESSVTFIQDTKQCRKKSCIYK